MIDIHSRAQWCPHCEFWVDVKTHHETCEFAALKKEVEELRTENSRLREIFQIGQGPRSWCDNG